MALVHGPGHGPVYGPNLGPPVFLFNFNYFLGQAIIFGYANHQKSCYSPFPPTNLHIIDINVQNYQVQACKACTLEKTLFVHVLNNK